MYMEQQEQQIIKRPGWFSRNIIAPIATRFLKFDYSINQASIAAKLAKINNENKTINNLSFPLGEGEIESDYDKLPIFSTAKNFPNNTPYKIKLFFLGYGQTIENVLDTVSDDKNEFTVFVPLGYPQNSLMEYLEKHAKNGCNGMSIETMSMGVEMLNKAVYQYNLTNNNNNFKEGRELFNTLKQQHKLTIYNAPEPQGSIASNMANVMGDRRGEIIQEQGSSQLPWYKRFGKWILNKFSQKSLESLVHYCVDKKLNEGDAKINTGFNNLLESANIQQAVTLRKCDKQGEVYDTMLGTNILANNTQYQKNRTLILGDHTLISGGALTKDQYLKLVDLGIQDTPKNLNRLRIMNYDGKYLERLLELNKNDEALKEILQRDIDTINHIYNYRDQIDKKIKNLPKNQQKGLENERNGMINSCTTIAYTANTNNITISDVYAIGNMIKKDEIKNKDNKVENSKDKMIIDEINNFSPVVLKDFQNLNSYQPLFRIASKGIDMHTFDEFHRLYNTGLESKTNYFTLSGLLNDKIDKDQKLSGDDIYEKMFDVYVDREKQNNEDISQDKAYKNINKEKKVSLMKQLLENFKKSKSVQEQKDPIKSFEDGLNTEYEEYFKQNKAIISKKQIQAFLKQVEKDQQEKDQQIIEKKEVDTLELQKKKHPYAFEQAKKMKKFNNYSKRNSIRKSNSMEQ